MQKVLQDLYEHFYTSPGFRLAWKIANQIQNYDGCSDCSQRAEPDTRQLFYKEAAK